MITKQLERNCSENMTIITQNENTCAARRLACARDRADDLARKKRMR